VQKSKPTSIAVEKSWWRRYPRTILLVVTLACLLPFADKAVHIDDPLFIWAGRQMQTRWWDPYGFDVNWYGWSMPMHEVTKNPPLACAFIALLASVFGETEFTLHLGFLAQAIAVVLGTHALARRLCQHPVHAALATLFTPVFLVSATTLMCDVLMLAFWVWAIEFWLKGIDEKRGISLAFAAFLMGASALSKYFGIALIPLLIAYTLFRKEKPGWWLSYFLIPLGMLGLFEVATWSLHGHTVLLEAFSYASENESRRLITLGTKIMIAVGFVGGCCSVGLFFLPLLWKTKLPLWIPIVALLQLPIAWFLTGSLVPNAESNVRSCVTLLWTLMVFGGLYLLALPVMQWRRNKRAEETLLWLWVWGTLAFSILNWTTNGRSILPMLPAIAILLVRQIEPRKRGAGVGQSCSLAASALFSLLIAIADYRFANSARTAATVIQDKFGASSTIWFQGHWGFQYYAQANGWRAFDLKSSQVNPGDLMILPFNNTNLKPLGENKGERVATIEVPVLPLVATMNRQVGAGFYMDKLGPLPFSFGAVPSERYYIIWF
jgi:4-amino-4-deoxy-L-arabinose transferase-like glycosyltransferase